MGFLGIFLGGGYFPANPGMISLHLWHIKKAYLKHYWFKKNLSKTFTQLKIEKKKSYMDSGSKLQTLNQDLKY